MHKNYALADTKNLLCTKCVAVNDIMFSPFNVYLLNSFKCNSTHRSLDKTHNFDRFNAFLREKPNHKYRVQHLRNQKSENRIKWKMIYNYKSWNITYIDKNQIELLVDDWFYKLDTWIARHATNRYGRKPD